MFRIRMSAFLMALLCMVPCILPAKATQVDSGSVYCFTKEDFSPDESFSGICITALPGKATGTLKLGNRVLRPGDILTAEQVSQMTFHPTRTEIDRTAEVGYLPIYESSVASAAAMSISVMGKENKPPIAEDMALETYKNLPLSGKLKVSEPEGEALTFSVTRQSKRGTIAISGDGSFTYTPKKNKVGVDSFTFTATDTAGKVSREATVTINILKPTNATQYTDTIGKDCRFEAEWMKNTGIFMGEKVAGLPCFSPERTVTRGEFLTMAVKALEIPLEEDVALTGYADEIPQWLQPYLAAAVRSGLTAELSDQEAFSPEEPIALAEAAAMLGIHPDPDAAIDTAATESLEEMVLLTRAEAARLLYKAVSMNKTSVFTE